MKARGKGMVCPTIPTEQRCGEMVVMVGRGCPRDRGRLQGWQLPLGCGLMVGR